VQRIFFLPTLRVRGRERVPSPGAIVKRRRRPARERDTSEPLAAPGPRPSTLAAYY